MQAKLAFLTALLYPARCCLTRRTLLRLRHFCESWPIQPLRSNAALCSHAFLFLLPSWRKICSTVHIGCEPGVNGRFCQVGALPAFCLPPLLSLQYSDAVTCNGHGQVFYNGSCECSAGVQPSCACPAGPCVVCRSLLRSHPPHVIHVLQASTLRIPVNPARRILSARTTSSPGALLRQAPSASLAVLPSRTAPALPVGACPRALSMFDLTLFP